MVLTCNVPAQLTAPTTFASNGSRAEAEERFLRGSVFIYEFSWDAYDGRAAAWLGKHDLSPADNSVAGWRREHNELHTTATIKKALYARFEPVVEVRRPYLARMLGRADLEATEHALIDAQMLPALGLWTIARRAEA